MTPTSLNESSLELTIMAGLTGISTSQLTTAIAEAPTPWDADWRIGTATDYDRRLGLDVPQLLAFIHATQPDVYAGLQLGQPESTGRQQLLRRISESILKDGVITVLRHGVRHLQYHVALYYRTPTAGNDRAAALFAANRFVVTRQLRYSDAHAQRALDLAIFINGLPIFTFELKNTITNQTMSDAQQQYRAHRLPNERIFRAGVCIAHWALDDQHVSFTTQLDGKQTRFLPFDRGRNDGAGNPPNPSGIRTDYLWKRILTRHSLADILESFVQQQDEKVGDSRRLTRRIIFPRYHQLDAVRTIVADAQQRGIGQRYLVQHSAGSGKSNTIAWLTYHLVSMQQASQPLFHSVVVVTDRRVLDSQISRTLRSMAHGVMAEVIGHAESSSELRTMIQNGKRIISTTVQKFPYILDALGNEHRARRFAIIIDEAHSSMGGSAAGAMNQAFSHDDDPVFDDPLVRMMAGRKMLANASYFAFTATPKSKTLELFGRQQPDGTFHPFHVYTMKQAIQEGFILDVLRNYTPYQSYYRLVKTIEDDPEVDVQKAGRQIRRFVESTPGPISRKARIIVDHFAGQKGNLRGECRAMVATQSVHHAIEYWKAINDELAARHWPWRCIVAFSDEHEVDGAMVSEADLNHFPSSEIPQTFRERPYRMLIVADKYLIGFDEPLLQVMYVDKTLTGVKAVQALSRLNRASPGKTETFVLDFANKPEVIIDSFQPYYRTTTLSHETDPNKLHDMQAVLDNAGVYDDALVHRFVERYLANAERPELDAMLDVCVDRYTRLDEDGQISFKGTAKGFIRTYNFLAQVLPWTNADWERRTILLTYLTPRLPSPGDTIGDSVPVDILQAIDLDSYRADKQDERHLMLEDDETALDPANPTNAGLPPDAEFGHLSEIVEGFNALFDDGKFTDGDRIAVQMNAAIVEIADDDNLRRLWHNSDPADVPSEFRKALRTSMGSNLQAYSELLLRLADPAFEDAFFPQAFQVYQALVQSRATR